MSRLIIGFTGEAGSGKDAASHYLEETYGAKSFGFSSILRDLIHRIYLPEERETMAKLSLSLREAFGQDLFGRVIAEDIRRDKQALIVLTGIRRDEDMVGIKNDPDFRLVYIEAPAELRYERVRMRGQNDNDATMTYEEFLRDSELETERTIRGLKSQAHQVIENTGDREEFYHILDTLLHDLGYQK